MHLVMFDIDGTLVQSDSFDDELYIQTINEVLDLKDFSPDWSTFKHITDTGLLDEILVNLKITDKVEEIHANVKSRFIELTTQYLSKTKAIAIPGAISFFETLKNRDDIIISIATGGWKETALLKLQSAGINIENITLASSSDHYSRVQIMKIAEAPAHNTTLKSKWYFGDADWDKTACSELDYNFILIGSRITHHTQFNDFTEIDDKLIFN